MLDDYELRGVNIDRGEDSFAASVLVTTGVLSRGFRLPAAQLQIFAETDLFEEERRAQDRARRSAAKAFLSDLRDLKVGDLVVHVDNGIGEFVGLKEMTVGPNETLEFLELRYAGDDKLFVPVSRLDLIQKYSGGARPTLDRLGGTTWEKAKTRVKKAMRDMAEELLKLYAARKAVAGYTLRAATRTGRRSSRARSRTTSPSTSRPPSKTSSATWSRRRPWTACCAATWATARPKSRCAPRSRR